VPGRGGEEGRGGEVIEHTEISQERIEGREGERGGGE